jgi:parallel beta-helix repeat protein
MKYPVLVLVACAQLILLSAVRAQGPLDPPAAPAPTMKTLEQVEPRIPISSLPYTISAPGSYYVTGNLTSTLGGITIAASGVTLDLMGHTLDGTGATGSGIFVSNLRNDIAIRNGIIRNWPGSGLSASNGRNVLIQNIQSAHNGTGIWTQDSATIIHSKAWSNELVGIRGGRGSIISHCTSFGNGDDGIRLFEYGVVESSTSTRNEGHGINGGVVCRIRDSTVAMNRGHGIFLNETAYVSGCIVNANGTNGIHVRSQSAVLNNVVDFHFTDGAGIHIQGHRSRVEGNHVTRGYVGLRIVGGANTYVAGNTVRDHHTNNYDFASGNHLNLLLSEIPETIAWPAHVTLAGSLTGASGQDGVTIAASDVTLDLNGHALVGVPGSLSGIQVSGIRENIAVRNGQVRGWGLDGANLDEARNSAIERVHAAGNGRDGLRGGMAMLIHQCAAWDNGENGINAVLGSAVVSDCVATFNGTDGITGGAYTTIRDSVARQNTGSGIHAKGSTVVLNNLCASNGIGPTGGGGIRATSARNRIEGNTCVDNDVGIQVDMGENFIIRNKVGGNTSSNYEIVPNNYVGPIVAWPFSGPVSGDSGGAGVGTTDPWANFTY